ncbi:hypothetical protein [Profundibacter sp.]
MNNTIPAKKRTGRRIWKRSAKIIGASDSDRVASAMNASEYRPSNIETTNSSANTAQIR